MARAMYFHNDTQIIFLDTPGVVTEKEQKKWVSIILNKKNHVLTYTYNKFLKNWILRFLKLFIF